jgi:hypothetical protein
MPGAPRIAGASIDELSDDYMEKTRPVVRRRLAQAAIRLAWLLKRR